jgi:hypothetical protein
VRLIQGWVLPCASRRFSVRKTLAFSCAFPARPPPPRKPRDTAARRRPFVALSRTSPVDSLRPREALHRLHKALCHRCDHVRRGHPHAELSLEEVDKPGTVWRDGTYALRYRRSIASSSNVTCWVRISATLLRIIVLELPESAAHVATDPKRVHYLGAGCNSCLAPGLLFF